MAPWTRRQAVELRRLWTLVMSPAVVVVVVTAAAVAVFVVV